MTANKSIAQYPILENIGQYPNANIVLTLSVDLLAGFKGTTSQQDGNRRAGRKGLQEWKEGLAEGNWRGRQNEEGAGTAKKGGIVPWLLGIDATPLVLLVIVS